MSDQKKLVVVITNGFDNERSSVAWSVANGGDYIPGCIRC